MPSTSQEVSIAVVANRNRSLARVCIVTPLNAITKTAGLEFHDIVENPDNPQVNVRFARRLERPTMKKSASAKQEKERHLPAKKRR